MGITRKMMSLGTVGLVDFRSDKERTAAYTRSTRNAARKQAKAMQQMAQNSAMQAPPVYVPVPMQPQGPPPGWYVDGIDPSIKRWWDGVRWTEHTQS